MQHVAYSIDQIDREQWDAFVAANTEDGGVLQSWAWGEFQESLGRTIWRLSWGEQKIEAACLLVEHRLPFGLKYLYAPRGPIWQRVTSNEKRVIYFKDIEEFAREKKVLFIRVEPSCHELPVTGYPLRVTASMQPRQTLRIDLTQSEEELLTAMHPKTRYNIRLAEKRGVSVQCPEFSGQSFENFWHLMQETAQRDGFHLHPREHYQKLLELSCCLLLTAYRQDTPLATALVAFFGKTAYYLHGASSNEHREVMAPYALHWSIMQEAKRQGCTMYDLWGIDERKWPGVTRFKRGFAPEAPITEYAGTYDVPMSPLYYLYRLWKLFR